MRPSRSPNRFVVALSLALVSVVLTGLTISDSSTGQTLYVPVYADIQTGPKGVTFSLDTKLIIRNTDMRRPITVTTADFYDTAGALRKRHLEAPIVLRPLETRTIYLPDRSSEGGPGANYIVRWTAVERVNAPIVECLMIGTRSGQGISFLAQGVVIEE